ncbi:CopG family transcriptional regulator [Panacagrimonas sp.]|uniref:ribbon-helix-helix domain-containing protein n=1 Tax=Panacagrimonas sp. TaxID=2480088 RepID=UPI003B526398
MGTLSLKVADALDRDITRMSRRQGITKSELMRRAVQLYLAQRDGNEPFVSALELAGDLSGSIEGAPPDLSTNPKYMEGYGE